MPTLVNAVTFKVASLKRANCPENVVEVLSRPAMKLPEEFEVLKMVPAPASEPQAFVLPETS